MNMPSTQLSSLSANLAKRLDIGIDGHDLINTLKQTAFKGEVSDSQMSALLIVAGQYGLNPWTKEIYAYPDTKNGIVPVVGVDGWSRIINEHPQFNGVEFNYSEETVAHKGKLAHAWIECILYRKDRDRPTVIREYFDEVCRSVTFVTPWDSHPKRMHRHKSLIQASRIAFGFSGIYDEDEAERITEKDITPPKEKEPEQPKELPEYPQAAFDKNFTKWKEAVEKGTSKKEEWIATLSKRGVLTQSQLDIIESINAPIEGELENANS